MGLWRAHWRSIALGISLVALGAGLGIGGFYLWYKSSPRDAALPSAQGLVFAREVYDGSPAAGQQVLARLMPQKTGPLHYPSLHFALKVCEHVLYRGQKQLYGQCDALWQRLQPSLLEDRAIPPKQKRELKRKWLAYRMQRSELSWEGQGLLYCSQSLRRALHRLRPGPKELGLAQRYCSLIEAAESKPPEKEGVQGRLLRQDIARLVQKEALANPQQTIFALRPFWEAILLELSGFSSSGVRLYRRGYYRLTQMYYRSLHKLSQKYANNQALAEGFPWHKLWRGYVIHPMTPGSPLVHKQSRSELTELLSHLRLALGRRLAMGHKGKATQKQESFSQADLQAATAKAEQLSWGLRLLAGHYFRLHGDLAFHQEDYDQSASLLSRATELLPWLEGAWKSRIAILALRGIDQEDISTRLGLEQDSPGLAMRFVQRYKDFYFNDTATNGSSDREQKEKVLYNQGESRALARKIQRVFQSLIDHPELRHRLPMGIDCGLGQGNRVYVSYKDGQTHIVMGEKFVRDLQEAVKKGLMGYGVDLDSLLAVVLGHELYHITAGHGRFLSGLQNSPQDYAFVRRGTGLSTFYQEALRSDLWQKEFAADEKGTMYAFLAGYNARAMLSLFQYWYQNNPLQPIVSGGHPSYRLRLRMLERKVAFLEQTTRLYRRFQNHLREVAKLQQNLFHKQNSMELRQRLENRLATVQGLAERLLRRLPNSMALNSRYSALLLRRGMLLDRVMELPVFVLHRSPQDLALPSGEPGEYGLLGSTETSFPQRKELGALGHYRPRLMVAPPYVQKSLALVRRAQARLQALKDKFSADPVVLNNLGLAHYWQAQLRIRSFLHSGKWSVPRSRLKRKLKLAERYLKSARSLAQERKGRITMNLFAVGVARIHVEQNLPSFRKKALESLLRRSYGSEGSGYRADLLPLGASFAHVYLHILDFALWESYMGSQLSHSLAIWQNKRDKLQDLSESAASYLPPQSYWRREYRLMANRLQSRSLVP